MPCQDITDILTLSIGHDDRVTDYSLQKRTCGGTVGEEKLIGPWLFRRTAAEVTATTNEQFLLGLRTKSDMTEYLAVKHFLAVRAAIMVLTGGAPGGLGDHCTIEAVEHGPEGVTVTAHIGVKALVEEIAACRNCCGSKGEAEGRFAV